MSKRVPERRHAFDDMPVTKMAWLLTNLHPKDTGLPMVIWVGPVSAVSRCTPRIRVQTVRGSKVDNGTFLAFSS